MGKSKIVLLALLLGVLVILFYAASSGPAETRRIEDPAGVFTVAVPTTFQMGTFNCGHVCDPLTKSGEFGAFDDYEFTLEPVDKPLGAEISIWLETPPVYKTFDELWSERIMDQFNSYELLETNGNRVFYRKVDFVGPANVEKYLDHYYVMEHEENIITFYLREKYSHDGNHEYANATKYHRDFISIVNSIEF